MEILSTNVVSSVRTVVREGLRGSVCSEGGKLGIFGTCAVWTGREGGVLSVDRSTETLFSSMRGTGGMAMLFLSRFPEKSPLILSRT